LVLSEILIDGQLPQLNSLMEISLMLVVAVARHPGGPGAGGVAREHGLYQNSEV
jgi:hypothetical protein